MPKRETDNMAHITRKKAEHYPLYEIHNTQQHEPRARESQCYPRRKSSINTTNDLQIGQNTNDKKNHANSKTKKLNENTHTQNTNQRKEKLCKINMTT